MGKRSMSAGFSHSRFALVPTINMATQMNATGSNDLTSEISTLGGWGAPDFLAALKKTGAAARKHGKTMNFAGLYRRPYILERVINEFSAKCVAGAQNVRLLLQDGMESPALLRSLQK